MCGLVLHPAGEAGACETPHTVTLTCRPFHASCVGSRCHLDASCVACLVSLRTVSG